MSDWLKTCHITTIAMESTGVYWLPAFEILEAAGFNVILVNARDAKNVPGRKTDVNDAQWLQKLHSFGLLRASFRPEHDISVLRSYLRQRERLTEYRAAHIQHMQKALMQMNVQLHHAVSDITGVTGLSIVRAIVSGERDPSVLIQYRDVRCKKTPEVLQQALTGNWQPEHLFALEQSVAFFDFYQEKIRECDDQIETSLLQLSTGTEEPEGVLPSARHRTKQPNQLSFDVRPLLWKITGADLTQIHGFGPYLALKFVAECGTDMNRWPDASHFTSWLCLSPGNKISGGKVLSSKTRRSSSRIAAALRLAATTIGRSDTALGAFYRRLSSRIGKAKAVTATARKLAILFYNALKYGQKYVDPGADYYEERYRNRVLDGLKRRAKSLGYSLQQDPELCV
jgi:transposase